jgi:Rrf2 family transcriptional regulator, iron-sulfur cluster assembly transcription factor
MISRSSEYAIRALTFLALQEKPRFHLARDMAELLGIPAPFLGKVLQPLVARNILSSQRGRSGGFKLARPASEIALLQIVETQENLEHLQLCILGQVDCSDERPCPLHSYWKEASQGFLRMLADTTLEHLAEHSRTHAKSSYPFPPKLAGGWATSLPSVSSPAEGTEAPRAACF